VVLLARLLRGRSAAAAGLCAAMLLAGGCQDAAPPAPEVVGAFGSTGRGDGEFLYPRAIDVAPDGAVLVVDKTGRVQRFSPEGRFLGAFAMPLADAGLPTGITIGPDGNVHLADTHYHRVVTFTPDGRLLRELGRFGTDPGCFIYPTDVAFAPDGRMFVSEYGGNDRVSVFDAEGRFLESFGAFGEAAGQFARPAAVCVDARRGRLYVADACNHRVAVYNLHGRLESYLGSAGRGEGQLCYPYDLALAADGALAVCEYGNNRVQVFSPDGRPLRVLGGPGRGLGQLAYPWGLAFGPDGTLYVVDAGNNRVQRWRL